ncbi:unnamed protein product [Ambrosiozyma monospora]|uniref:Unnamed protein product n=1 Tax=Ambrosiozyma monospora TaxID=43982 RepID=A0A9W6Z861_AMBMO|nr:unnamed protein product [Ambrosiozyma monospora]
MNLRTEPNSPLLRATVKSQRDADVVVKLSGARFANDVVRIRIIDTIGGTGTNTPNTIDLLKSFIASRYDANLKMLNLEGMVHDQTLISNGLFNTASTNSKFFTALMKIALQQKIDVQSVNLAGNDMNDYSKYLTELSLHFPKVKNLSLANNKISKLDFFTKVRNRFSLLRELIISGNPIVNMNFHADIVKLFPRLVVLDGTPVRDEAKLNAIMTFPVPTAPMFFETPDLQKVATNFISTYLQMWDNQRMDLLSLYTAESQFSFMTDSIQIGEAANAPANSWNNYTFGSRNLKKISGAKQRQAKLNIGQEAIGQAFQSLVQTKHTLQEHPELYSVETTTYPTLNGMHIVVHGEFEETGQPQQPQQQGFQKGRGHYRSNNPSQQRGILQKRSFDRSFVVVPGNGGSFLIVSDMLLVKVHNEAPAWKIAQSQGTPVPAAAPTALASAPAIGVPGALPTGPTATNAIPSLTPGVVNPVAAALPPDVAAKLTPIQQELILKIMGETKLNVQFTLMLCEQSGWNYEVAGQNFLSSRAQIPPNAFQ